MSAAPRTPSPSTWSPRCSAPVRARSATPPRSATSRSPAACSGRSGIDVEHRRRRRPRRRPGRDPEPQVPAAFSGLNRIPILMVGPLLHRTGEAFVPLVGGDPIGAPARRLPRRGAARRWAPRSRSTDEGVDAKATPLHGARIDLPYPSVGATETVLLSAVLAEGTTVLENAATEPEVDRARAVPPAHGRPHRAAPDRRFIIEGVERLHGRRRTGSPATASRRSPTWWPGWSPAARCGCTAAPGPAGHRHHHARSAWAPASRSPTTGCRRRRPTACGRRRCRPTPTPGS